MISASKFCSQKIDLGLTVSVSLDSVDTPYSHQQFLHDRIFLGNQRHSRTMINMIRQAQRIFLEKLGADHPSTLQARNLLAFVEHGGEGR